MGVIKVHEINDIDLFKLQKKDMTFEDIQEIRALMKDGLTLEEIHHLAELSTWGTITPKELLAMINDKEGTRIFLTNCEAEMAKVYMRNAAGADGELTLKEWRSFHEKAADIDGKGGVTNEEWKKYEQTNALFSAVRRMFAEGRDKEPIYVRPSEMEDARPAVAGGKTPSDIPKEECGNLYKKLEELKGRGELTQEEAETVRTMARAADGKYLVGKDGTVMEGRPDGKLTLEEWCDYFTFSVADKDLNGYISDDEGAVFSGTVFNSIRQWFEDGVRFIDLEPSNWVCDPTYDAEAIKLIRESGRTLDIGVILSGSLPEGVDGGRIREIFEAADGYRCGHRDGIVSKENLLSFAGELTERPLEKNNGHSFISLHNDPSFKYLLGLFNDGTWYIIE